MIIDVLSIWFVSIDFIENWVETTHDDIIQYSSEWWTSRWWHFVSVASGKLLLTTRHFIPNRLTVRSGKIRYEIPYVRSSTGWPKYTIEPIILILVEWSETNSNTGGIRRRKRTKYFIGISNPRPPWRNTACITVTPYTKWDVRRRSRRQRNFDFI